jgi:hypothetical protein
MRIFPIPLLNTATLAPSSAFDASHEGNRMAKRGKVSTSAANEKAGREPEPPAAE